ncbi:MAG: DUF3025 domain-containing protein [Gammaproteobacteria bacterium]|nr:DUF3025 domain-containing protein [Gammaproteobacteria bacterium]
MPKTIISPWQPQHMRDSLLFQPLLAFSQRLEDRTTWPSVEDMNTALFSSRDVISGGGKPICLVEQSTKPNCFEHRYAPRIYLEGEIQTRENNWHDYFQAISWRMFPITKVTTNSLHFSAAQKAYSEERPSGTRSPMENALSQFDECGVIVVSDRQDLLDHIRRFEWHTLFWEKRSLLAKHLRCVVFGHAIYEKAIHPYIGLTAKALLFETPDTTLQLPIPKLVNAIDKLCAEYFHPVSQLTSPRQLQPFPILGMPGFSIDNENETYYLNADYFRPAPTPRKLQSIPV